MAAVIDPDILAIQRRRRQEGRCVRCGADAGRAVLCATCRASWRYCPRCERVVPLAEAHVPHRHARQTSAPCKRCVRAARSQRHRRDRQPRDDWLAEQRARIHPDLPRMIELYSSGATIEQIAAALGTPRNTVSSRIGHARATGRWPKRLRHGRGYRPRGET